MVGLAGEISIFGAPGAVLTQISIEAVPVASPESFTPTVMVCLPAGSVAMSSTALPPAVALPTLSGSVTTELAQPMSSSLSKSSSTLTSKWMLSPTLKVAPSAGATKTTVGPALVTTSLPTSLSVSLLSMPTLSMPMLSMPMPSAAMPSVTLSVNFASVDVPSSSVTKESPQPESAAKKTIDTNKKRQLT